MNEKTYATSDLSLAATLAALGGNICFVEHTSPRANFHIERTSDIEKIVAAFYARKLSVEPLTYFNALRDAKTQLYSRLQGE